MNLNGGYAMAASTQMEPWLTPKNRRPYWPDGEYSPELTDEELRAHRLDEYIGLPFSDMSWHKGFAKKHPDHPSLKA